MLILTACITRIRLFYPENTILICKTSDSHIPDLSGYANLEIHNTFVDGSHIIGAIELLIRKCKTTNFLLCHDSMFLLRELPISILDKEFYSLWHFNERSQYFWAENVKECILSSNIHKEDIDIMDAKYRKSPDEEYNGIFGPAFGGSLHALTKIWGILNVTKESVNKYLGREGLMASERVFSVIFRYMGFDTGLSLNGNIYDHPEVFNATTVPTFNEVNYPQSYFYKIWQKR